MAFWICASRSPMLLPKPMYAKCMSLHLFPFHRTQCRKSYDPRDVAFLSDSNLQRSTNRTYERGIRASFQFIRIRPTGQPLGFSICGNRVAFGGSCGQPHFRVFIRIWLLSNVIDLYLRRDLNPAGRFALPSKKLRYPDSTRFNASSRHHE